MHTIVCIKNLIYSWSSRHKVLHAQKIASRARHAFRYAPLASTEKYAWLASRTQDYNQL